MQIPRAIAGWRAFFRRTAINVFPRISNFWAETNRPLTTSAEPSAADPMTARDRCMKEGRVKSAQENASPSSGAQTIGLLQEWISDRVICRSAEFFPEIPVPEIPAEPLRLRSRIARVIGETVMEPIARDVATVTVARGPKNQARNGKGPAAARG